MIPYFFYKNLVMTLPALIYAFYAGFSGQTLYEDYYIALFNLVFTNQPLLYRAMLDFDVSPTIDGA
jgi:phospholipid-translocating ATPase